MYITSYNSQIMEGTKFQKASGSLQNGYSIPFGCNHGCESNGLSVKRKSKCSSSSHPDTHKELWYKEEAGHAETGDDLEDFFQSREIATNGDSHFGDSNDNTSDFGPVSAWRLDHNGHDVVNDSAAGDKNDDDDGDLGDDDFGDFRGHAGSKSPVTLDHNGHDVVNDSAAGDKNDNDDDYGLGDDDFGDFSGHAGSKSPVTMDHNGHDVVSDSAAGDKNDDDYYDFGDDDFGDFSGHAGNKSPVTLERNGHDVVSDSAAGDKNDNDDDYDDDFGDDDFGDFNGHAGTKPPVTFDHNGHDVVNDSTEGDKNENDDDDDNDDDDFGDDDIGNFSGHAGSKSLVTDSSWANFASAPISEEKDKFCNNFSIKSVGVTNPPFSSKATSDAEKIQWSTFRKPLLHCFPESPAPALSLCDDEGGDDILKDPWQGLDSARLLTKDLGSPEPVTKHGIHLLPQGRTVQCLPRQDAGVQLWCDLQNIDDSAAVGYQWSRSSISPRLLQTLSIDTQNMLIGHKKPSVPVLTTGLSLLGLSRGRQRETESGKKAAPVSTRLAPGIRPHTRLHYTQ